MYPIKKMLGKGAFGSVYLIDFNGSQAAMKIYKPSQSNIENQINNFLQLEKKIRPSAYKKYFVKMLYYKKPDYIILEYLSTKKWITLNTFLNSDLSYPIYFIIKNLLQAVDILQKNNISHNDLHDENIMINRNGNIKIIDFGSMDINSSYYLNDLNFLTSLIYLILNRQNKLSDLLQGKFGYDRIVECCIGIDLIHEGIDLKKFEKRAKELSYYKFLN